MPEGLVGPDRLPSARRFAVYRNNVLMGLANGLGEAFPVVKRLVGDAFFRAMAAEFAATHPPGGPMLFAWGAAFPGFLEVFPPVAELPYLPDVARLERAWTEAYHAADETPVGPEAVQAEGADLGEVRLRLIGSTRVVTSDFPIVAIWQANQEGATETELPAAGETALIARPGADGGLWSLSSGIAAFTLALLAGRPLGAAAETGLTAEPGFDVAGAIGGLFGLGLVAGTR